MGNKFTVITALFTLVGVVALFGFQQTSSHPAKDFKVPEERAQLDVRGNDIKLDQGQSIETENTQRIEATRAEQAAEFYQNEELFPGEQVSKEALIDLGRQQRLQGAAERGELNEFLSAEDEREQKHKERELLRKERMKYAKEQKKLHYDRLQAYREQVRAGEEATRPDLAPMAIPDDLKR